MRFTASEVNALYCELNGMVKRVDSPEALLCNWLRDHLDEAIHLYPESFVMNWKHGQQPAADMVSVPRDLLSDIVDELRGVRSYYAIVAEANKILERDGEPFRFGCDGIAVCKDCGLTWFPNERWYPACEHNIEWQQ